MAVLTLRQVLVQSYVTGGTDGGALDLEWDDLDPLVHPRHIGTVPRWLGTYVREEKLMTWEEAIRKLAALPAEIRSSARSVRAAWVSSIS